ncbi:MAG: glycosyltransferase [Clostridia bacterium]|nr:glycosyltransferase [Clostridia bacterium]
MDKIAVLIPCYNEAKTIEKVVEDFRHALPGATIYVYDNNSTDGTGELAKKAGAVVRPEHMQGKGNVIRRMFREVDAMCYVLVDGDDTYPAESAPEMAALVLEEQADMVIGDRLSSTYFTENKRPFHNFGNSLVRGTINRLFGSNILDIMTGYRAFSYRFVKTYPVLSKGFEIETDMTVHAIYRNMLVRNVVVTYRDRPAGSESKLNTGKDGFKVLMTIGKLYKNYKPFSFFSILALLLILASILFVTPVLREFIQTGMVPRFPTLITCLFSVLAGLLLFICGLILSSLQEKDRRDFEYQLVETEERFIRAASPEQV